MARLNDTSALVSQPMRNGGTVTKSVRKIDNGYITKTSEYNDKTGQYKCASEYSKDVPSANGGGRARSGVGSEGLSDVKNYLGKDV